MINLRNVYIFVFILIVISCFVIGGVVQFFIGVPNTVFSVLLSGFFLAFYCLYVLVKHKVFLDRVVLLHLILGMLIIISAVLNETSLIKTLIYFIFVFLPLGCYLFFKVNQKENYISQLKISRIFLVIACLQLPVILVQHFGYDFLIDFNRSNQSVSEIDFMFGTFFLKADHALGYFILFNIFNLIENNEDKKITKYPTLFYLYFGATILASESNISKLILGVFVLYMIYRTFPKKIKILGILAVIISSPFLISQLIKFKAVEHEIYIIKKEYNVKKSYINYERGIAKRPQVIITYASKIPLKIFGDGPYSYFNILKGKFSKTKHFSQILWMYADLGIIGLVIFIMLLYAIVKNLELSNHINVFVFGITLVFSLMTTIFSDLCIMITLMCILQNRKRIE
ncbi:hypothetical protein [Formosa sp. L2A11]|uniref:hypothetical protein n=1 Tax=Formosa sp. L2A11 TaxID=2686363 RepID=UPI00131AE790|nr:hypothetical protein [Formosa sp. L2A11]